MQCCPPVSGEGDKGHERADDEQHGGVEDADAVHGADVAGLACRDAGTAEHSMVMVMVTRDGDKGCKQCRPCEHSVVTRGASSAQHRDDVAEGVVV